MNIVLKKLKSFASRKYLLHDVILKRKLYSPKFLSLVNNALQGTFGNILSYYLFLDSILIRYSFPYMIRIFQIESIYDSCIKSVTEAICNSYSKHESQSFTHVYPSGGFLGHLKKIYNLGWAFRSSDIF